MPIEHAPPPPNGHTLLIENLGVILQGPAAHRHGAPVTTDQVHVSEPHPSYHYGLDALLDGGDLDRALDGGWRYFVYDDTDLIGIAHLGYEADGVSPRFAGLSSGPSVDASLAALVYIEAHAAVRAEAFVLRSIHVPAVQFSALWMHGAADHFIPIHAAWGLEPQQIYPWAEIVQALLPRAAEVQTQAGFA